MILKDWASLGLTAEPTTGNNCVHASASPFEGLAERMNWLKVSPEQVSYLYGRYCPEILKLIRLAVDQQDPFGAKALLAGIPVQAIKDWSVDPQVKGKSIFDQLEDTDAKECVEKMTDLL